MVADKLAQHPKTTQEPARESNVYKVEIISNSQEGTAPIFSDFVVTVNSLSANPEPAQPRRYNTIELFGNVVFIFRIIEQH